MQCGCDAWPGRPRKAAEGVRRGARNGKAAEVRGCGGSPAGVFTPLSRPLSAWLARSRISAAPHHCPLEWHWGVGGGAREGLACRLVA
eukprot:2849488-Prymnesium_polylepis.1